MKLKDIVMNQDELKLNTNYDDFIETSEIPEESIEIDSKGRIISNKTSLLKFIDFLVTQFEFCPEKKSTEEFADEAKKKKSKKRYKNIPYSQLPLKVRKKRIKNMDHFLNGQSNFPI